MATNNPIPLFLSDPIEVPEQAGSLQHGKERLLRREYLRQLFVL
jgi:hypothetical protein